MVAAMVALDSHVCAFLARQTLMAGMDALALKLTRATGTLQPAADT